MCTHTLPGTGYSLCAWIARGGKGQGLEAGGAASPGSRIKAGINSDVICSQCGCSSSLTLPRLLRARRGGRTIKAWLKAVHRHSNSQSPSAGLTSLLGGCRNTRFGGSCSAPAQLRAFRGLGWTLVTDVCKQPRFMIQNSGLEVLQMHQTALN